jgi:NAD-dependent dihydropyrimidine dehydrogenase PreA subunit
VIELVSPERCITCDKCVKVCPTNVFDRVADGIPVISRQDDCQTCFQCEANCPVDALFVAPYTHPLPQRPTEHDLGDLLGSYREDIGWGHGRTPGSLRAIGPALSPNGSAITS